MPAGLISEKLRKVGRAIGGRDRERERLGDSIALPRINDDVGRGSYSKKKDESVYIRAFGPLFETWN
jgi:hypothetical protein